MAVRRGAPLLLAALVAALAAGARASEDGAVALSGSKHDKRHGRGDENGEARYGMMIDAGSEGSRIVIFTWRSSEPQGSRKVVQPSAIGNLSITPGIGSFALHPHHAGESLAPLIKYAQRALERKKASWGLFPIWLRATAGMRLLHADEREAVLADVQQYLRKSGFYFKDDMAVVITGEEEGIYGWIAVNCRMGGLCTDEPGSNFSTLGSLDLGGASTQIVFIPEKSIMAHAYPVSLGPHRLRVYTWSFLHFGQRESAHGVADIIISDALTQVQSVSKLTHPCYSIGYDYKPHFTYSDSRRFPMEVTMEGSSDYAQCEALIQRIFRKDAPCLVQACSFYGVYQPHVYDNLFVAFSHFADVAIALALPRDARLSDLRVASEYVCSLSFEQLNIIFARVQGDYDRFHLCFHAAYVYVLLTYGFGFDPGSRQVLFKGDLADDRPIDYIDGAMVYEINQDPWLTCPSSEPSLGIDYSSLVDSGTVSELARGPDHASPTASGAAAAAEDAPKAAAAGNAVADAGNGAGEAPRQRPRPRLQLLRE